MNQARNFELFNKVLVPVIYGYDPSPIINLARLLAEEQHLLLLGVVPIRADESLSAGYPQVQNLRKTLRKFSQGAKVVQASVTHRPWTEVCDFAASEEANLLLLDWPTATEALGVSLDEILSHPPCDICISRNSSVIKPKDIVVPIRGGPYSELALRLALASSHSSKAKVRTLHVRTPHLTPKQDAAFKGLSLVLENLPEVEQLSVNTSDPAAEILRISKDSDLVIMGSSAFSDKSRDPFGHTAEQVLTKSSASVLIVRTKRAMPSEMESEMVGQKAISVLVDKWFAENTFHANEFTNLNKLREIKQSQNLRISIALPALNEEQTIRNVIRTLKNSLMDRSKLVDEIILMDSGSVDRTREIASDLGIPVYIHQDVLPQHGARDGKGEALWKSLFVTQGDIVIWIDTDILNINPRFVYGLIGPLLTYPHLQFAKGFYRRPIKIGNRRQAGGGGRVTELTARPLLNLFYPELSGLVQPLSGEYGGRRSALEQLSFFSGYGVETGLLIDIFERYGLSAISQVDLQERIHHNQPLEALSLMSFAIIQAVFTKLGKRYGQELLDNVNRTMKLIRYKDDRYFLNVEEISELERPPMISVSEYKNKHKGEQFMKSER